MGFKPKKTPPGVQAPTGTERLRHYSICFSRVMLPHIMVPLKNPLIWVFHSNGISGRSTPKLGATNRAPSYRTWRPRTTPAKIVSDSYHFILSPGGPFLMPNFFRSSQVKNPFNSLFMIFFIRYLPPKVLVVIPNWNFAIQHGGAAR